MHSFRAAISSSSSSSDGSSSSSSDSSSRRDTRFRWTALTASVVLALTGGGLLLSRENTFVNHEASDESGPLQHVEDAGQVSDESGPLLHVEDAGQVSGESGPLLHVEDAGQVSDESGPLLHVEDAGQVKVYVYDDPVFDTTALIECYRDAHGDVPPWQDERADMAQDMGEIWLHQALLSHPWRVLDPEDADVFFIPLYPALSSKLFKNQRRGTCGGLTHRERMTRSIMHLVKNSVYFNRFGGADHAVVCAWWSCGRTALDSQHRMLLRRTVVGVNEELDIWSSWGCGERMVTVPYTASSALTTAGAIGGRSAEERDIPFFFAGSGRGRRERKNLKIAEDLSPNSVIDIGGNGHVWSVKAPDYADLISRSRFCFCPRGDTLSSRRIFDAVSAGCIPVLSAGEASVLPFLRTGLNYSEFAVVEDTERFRTKKGVRATVRELLSRSDEQLTTLREGLARQQSSIVYGVTTGPELSDMEPFPDTASRFLLEVRAILDTKGLWNCPALDLEKENQPGPRSSATFPIRQDESKQWLRESETIVNMEHSLLFCAPPNTGSLQFRMLAKRMEGVTHWWVPNDQSLLFDSVDSKLPLLNVTDTGLMKDIYTSNNSGWIKIGVVRDPVSRVLSAYLDLIRVWPSGATTWASLDHGERKRRRGLQIGDDWEWFNAIRRLSGLKEEEADEKPPELGAHEEVRAWGNIDEEGRPRESKRVLRGVQDEAVPTVPTFEEILDLLAVDLWAAPSAFRPAASLCGMNKSPFDTIIPFETLQRTSTKVLKSLPGDIWRSFGESGWGPEGKHRFMEYDYGTAARHDVYVDEEGAGRLLKRTTADGERGKRHHREANTTRSAPPTVPPRASDMFTGDSCAWIEYYADQKILEKVGHLYSEDFDLFEWYNLDSWRDRLKACLQGHR